MAPHMIKHCMYFPKLPPLSLHGIVLVTADVEEIRKL